MFVACVYQRNVNVVNDVESTTFCYQLNQYSYYRHQPAEDGLILS